MASYPKQHVEYNDQPPAYTETGYTSGVDIGFKVEGQHPEPTAPNQPFISPVNPVSPVVQPNVVYVGVPVRLGDNRTQTICPNCRANVLTNIKHQTGLVTWLIAGGLCFFGLWCGCCLIPFCSNSCKDVEHYCPNCRYLIGRNKKL